jgi:hypothetical protein
MGESANGAFQYVAVGGFQRVLKGAKFSNSKLFENEKKWF